MSERDKKLLSVLAVLLLIVLVYYLGYRPLNKREKLVQREISSLEAELTDLRADYEKMEQFQLETEEGRSKIKEIQKAFPGLLNQERAFRFLFDVEEYFGDIEFTSVSFSDISTVFSSDDKNDENTIRLLSQEVFTSIDAEYDIVKEFLDFVNAYPDKTVASNLSLTLNEEDGLINTSFVLTMYALEGESIPKIDVEFDPVEVGNPIPFNSPNVDIDLKEEEAVEYPTDGREDLFITIKPQDADGFAQTIGLVGNPTKSSYVETDENAAQAANLRVYEENGEYYWNYDIGGTFKGRQAFDLGSIIEIVVYSSERINANDRVTMNATINNQTDIPVIISVIDEDKATPRFNLVSTEGEVIVK